MKLIIKTFTVEKKFALQISRETTAQTTNIWLRIQADNLEGWGEASPFSVDLNKPKDTLRLLAEFKQIIPQLESFHPLQRQEIGTKLAALNVASPIQAAVDMALYDWLGKKAGLPLWQILGLNSTASRLNNPIVPISVTIGISTPELALKRLQDWQDTLDVQIIKLKLGSPQGLAADKAMVRAIRQAAPQTAITIDANGGWSFDDAVMMADWLADREVKYIEQPLPIARDDRLKALSGRSPLPIFVDESCFTSADIIRLADSVAGVNLKIMKTGGLTEAIKAIQIAKAFNLQVMFGCYSDSSLANTAMAQLSSLADYLDLDSHLNLTNDPFQGAIISSGRLLPNSESGLGVKYSADS